MVRKIKIIIQTMICLIFLNQTIKKYCFNINGYMVY